MPRPLFCIDGFCSVPGTNFCLLNWRLSVGLSVCLLSPVACRLLPVTSFPLVVTVASWQLAIDSCLLAVCRQSKRIANQLIYTKSVLMFDLQIAVIWLSSSRPVWRPEPRHVSGSGSVFVACIISQEI